MLRMLSIAGSDSGGGAGIQADLKTFTALGAHGMTALTALTAQHTLGVTAVHVVPAAFVRAQIQAVADELVALACPVVVDPVMVATSGARLLDEDAADIVRQRLLPLATVVTPNLAEARILAEDRSATATDAANVVLSLGAAAVVVTGGDKDGVDWFHDANGPRPIKGRLHPSATTHGTGCTHSAALAVYLARGYSPFDAALAARALTAAAVEHGSVQIGQGQRPVNVASAVAHR